MVATWAASISQACHRSPLLPSNPSGRRLPTFRKSILEIAYGEPQYWTMVATQGGDNHEDVDAGEAITSTGLQGEAGEKPASNGDTVGQASGLFPEDEETQPKRIACLWLEALAGCLKGQVWEVGPTGGTLGRASDNTLSLADKEMSRRHSKVRITRAWF